MFSCDFCKISSNIFFYRTTPDSCFWNITFCSWNSAISPWIFVRTQNRVVATPLLIEFNLLYLVFNLCKSLACLFKCVFNMSRLKSSLSLLIIRIKFQNGCFETGVSRKQSTSNFPKNEHFLPCAYQGVRNGRFLKLPFWDSPFCITTDELSLYFGTLFHQTMLKLSLFQRTDGCIMAGPLI